MAAVVIMICVVRSLNCTIRWGATRAEMIRDTRRIRPTAAFRISTECLETQEAAKVRRAHFRSMQKSPHHCGWLNIHLQMTCIVAVVTWPLHTHSPPRSLQTHAQRLHSVSIDHSIAILRRHDGVVEHVLDNHLIDSQRWLCNGDKIWSRIGDGCARVASGGGGAGSGSTYTQLQPFGSLRSEQTKSVR